MKIQFANCASKMLSILFIKCLFLISVYSLPSKIPTIDTTENELDESITKIEEHPLDFDYNEDYSQFKISSDENMDYIDLSTQKDANLESDAISAVVTMLYDHNSNILEDINSTFIHENMMNSEQILLNKIRTIFNVGQISMSHKVPNEYTAPQFMTDLYHTIKQQNDNILHTIAYGATTIISIPEINTAASSLFKFNLDELSDQEILEAELHIYRIGREVSIPLHHSPYYLLRVYQVLPNDNLLSRNPDEHQLLNVHYVSSFITGWQVFKIKRAVDSWLNETAPNLGFLITASTVVNEPIDINFARKNRFSNKYQPSLVLFTKPKNEHVKINYDMQSNNILDFHNSQHFKCSKIPKYINFSANHFNNFVLEPKGYEAYECTGTCIHPEYLQSPNYSLLKSIFGNLENTLNNICCVPEKFKHLIVLYLSGEKIVLQKIENMIIDSCSCR